MHECCPSRSREFACKTYFPQFLLFELARTTRLLGLVIFDQLVECIVTVGPLFNLWTIIKWVNSLLPAPVFITKLLLRELFIPFVALELDGSFLRRVVRQVFHYVNLALNLLFFLDSILCLSVTTFRSPLYLFLIRGAALAWSFLPSSEREGAGCLFPGRTQVICRQSEGPYDRRLLVRNAR